MTLKFKALTILVVFLSSTQTTDKKNVKIIYLSRLPEL